jgi:hypothetical protein
MALQITKTQAFQIAGTDIMVDSLYVRFQFDCSSDGKKINCKTDFYLSKAKYQAGQPVQAYAPFKSQFELGTDYQTTDKPSLDLIQTLQIAYLKTEGINAEVA